ncbi:MAG TPA: nitronate monooxygenase [Candidatus Binataceae bacterium]|nr:nitronate monooxygenase [Candidatus Binataceae bacterium]
MNCSVEYPIVSAGMGGVALAELAAAVSNAGGIGTIALAGFTPEAIQNEIAAARKLTNKPLMVNLLVPFLRPGIIETVVREPVQGVTLFWGNPADYVPIAKKSGQKVIWQCGSVKEAVAARDAGADVIMVQGFEAGGHVRGTVTSLALIPSVRDAIRPAVPVIAAGGFADGRGLAAALALGADAAAFGTRFLASNEVAADPRYQQRILEAEAEETVHTELYDIGWPNAPHRVLRTKVVEEWERAGRPPTGKRPGEGESIGKMTHAGIEVLTVKYSVTSPANSFEGDIEELPLYAGMSVSLVREKLPAGEIVRRIAGEAQEVIASLASMTRRASSCVSDPHS